MITTIHVHSTKYKYSNKYYSLIGLDNRSVWVSIGLKTSIRLGPQLRILSPKPTKQGVGLGGFSLFGYVGLTGGFNRFLVDPRNYFKLCFSTEKNNHLK
jgi:hypothetical protein